MASQNFFRIQSPQPEMKIIAGNMHVSGTQLLSTTGSGIATGSRHNAGQYSITLNDRYNQVQSVQLSWEAPLGSSSLRPVITGSQAQSLAGTLSLTGNTIVAFSLVSGNSAPVDPVGVNSTGPQGGRIHFAVFLRNTDY